jgi:hypothetical protein
MITGATCAAERETLSLDGRWQIDESVSPTSIPTGFVRTVPVPGLADMAEPEFKDVNLFDSRELSSNRIRTPGSKVPESARVRSAGIPGQARNYFWYRRTFRAPGTRSIATLKVSKAQFGTSAWLNGKLVGEHAGCFTAGYFDLTKDIRWGADNDLLIRVGAHPAVLPDTYPAARTSRSCSGRPGSMTVSPSSSPTIPGSNPFSRAADRDLGNRGADEADQPRTGRRISSPAFRHTGQGNSDRCAGQGSARETRDRRDADAQRNDTNSRREPVVTRAPEPVQARDAD